MESFKSFLLGTPSVNKIDIIVSKKKYVDFYCLFWYNVFMDVGGRQITRISLLILAQAVEDVLRFELGLPLEGVSGTEEDALYEEAKVYIMRYPSLVKRYKRLNNRKLQWLREVENARE